MDTVVDAYPSQKDTTTILLFAIGFTVVPFLLAYAVPLFNVHKSTSIDSVIYGALWGASFAILGGLLVIAMQGKHTAMAVSVVAFYILSVLWPAIYNTNKTAAKIAYAPLLTLAISICFFALHVGGTSLVVTSASIITGVIYSMFTLSNVDEDPNGEGFTPPT